MGGRKMSPNTILLPPYFCHSARGPRMFLSLCRQTNAHKFADKAAERRESWADKVPSNHDASTFQLLEQLLRIGRFHSAPPLRDERI